MRNTNSYLLALAVALPLVAVASQASAQGPAGRDAAIGKCVRQAHMQYPNEEDVIPRSEAYKACMVAAGFQP
jgi:hypothetical protein